MMVREWIIAAFLLATSDLSVFGNKLPPLASLLSSPYSPELYYNAMEMICDEGYPVQQHKVLSSGYIINVHRIPNGNRKQRVCPSRGGYSRFHQHVHPDFYKCVNESTHERPTGPPVLLQHGLFVASDSWLLQGSGFDLAYMLADRGYDVWLSDVRGNFYSRASTYKSVKSKEFWDFSFHEMGSEDIPAVIDYILAKTNHKQLYYIGHSMGTTIFFVMGATRPSYMSKVRLATLLAPVANVSLFLSLPPRDTLTNFLLRSLYEMQRRQTYEFAPRVNWFPLAMNQLCGPKSPLQDFCYDILIAIDGHEFYNVNRKNFTRMISHGPSGVSFKTFFHFYQIMQAQRVQHFDYGEEENFRRYHQAVPPLYNLRRVSAPIYLSYSDADIFVETHQVEELAKQLPNVVEMKKLTQFIHTDFIISSKAKEKVYEDVFKLMKKY